MRHLLAALLCAATPSTVIALASMPALAPACGAPGALQSHELAAERWFNVDGDAPTLERLRGRAVLIEFWATW